MRLKYQTAVATLVQFAAMSFLNIANGANSVVTTCHKEGGDCVGNLLVSIMFFLVVTGWFGCVWLLGYFAQENRGRRLALLLIGTEGLIALIASYNAQHHNDVLSLATSLLDIVLALWVSALALRLILANGKRITGRQPRKRRTPTL